MRSHNLQAHFRRLLLSPNLYVASVIYCAMLLIPCMTTSGIGGGASMSMLNYSQGGNSGFRFYNCTLVPALAYTVHYIDDYETRLLYVWCLRSGTERYATAYYLTSLVGGFLTGVFGILLFFGVNLLRNVPLFGGYYGGFALHEQIYLSGHHTLFVVLIVLEYATGTAAMAGVGAAFSSIFHHKLFGLGIPVAFFFLFNMFRDYLPSILSPKALTTADGYGIMPLPHGVAKFIGFLIYTITAGLITVTQIKRSVANA